MYTHLDSIPASKLEKWLIISMIQFFSWKQINGQCGIIRHFRVQVGTKYLVIKNLLFFLGTIHLHMNHVTTIKHKLLQKISSGQDWRYKLLFTKIIKLLWLEIIHLHQLPVLLVSTGYSFSEVLILELINPKYDIRFAQKIHCTYI